MMAFDPCNATLLRDRNTGCKCHAYRQEMKQNDQVSQSKCTQHKSSIGLLPRDLFRFSPFRTVGFGHFASFSARMHGSCSSWSFGGLVELLARDVLMSALRLAKLASSPRIVGELSETGELSEEN